MLLTTLLALPTALALDVNDEGGLLVLYDETGTREVNEVTPDGTWRALTDRGVLDRQPMFDRITPTGVDWQDGRHVDADVILWATGFRAAIDHLTPLRLREPGGGIRLEGTRVAADPRIHLVGYGPSASTIGANRAGRAAVRDIRRLLAQEPVAA